MGIRIIRKQDYEFDHTRSRKDDHSTSTEGARDVGYRSGSQKAKLLGAYATASRGCTDEDAAVAAGLTNTCYWKRCGELRRDGVIEQIPGETRPGSAGVSRMVCRITEAGLAALK